MYGALLGLGTVAGELPNSFVKRQLGVPPGRLPAGVGRLVFAAYDQVDLVPGIYVALRPIWRLSMRDAARIAGVVAAAHLGITWCARALRIFPYAATAGVYEVEAAAGGATAR